jgi:UDP-glucose 4-epimerase
MDDMSAGDQYAPTSSKNIIHETGNIRLLSSIRLSEYDLVYHLGEYSRIAPSFDNPGYVFRKNVRGSFELIEYCRRVNVPIVYAASSTKMAQEGPGHSPYSFFKSTVVDLIKNYSRWYGLEYSICYFYNVYGRHWTLPDPHSKWNTVVQVFERQWQKGEPITICGDGSQKGILLMLMILLRV